MAIFEVLLYQTYFGQRTVNRFNYVSSGTPGAALPSFALVDAMGFAADSIVAGDFPSGTIARLIQQTQSSAVIFDSVFCRDLYSDTDFYEAIYPGGIVGEVAGEALSPTMAYGFVSNRANLSIRRSTRRLVGVTELAQSTGGIVSAGTLAGLDAIADAFSAVLSYTEEGASLSFTPATLSRQKYTTPAGKRAYRKYPTEAEQLANTAIGITWGAYVQLRTQTSRQYGRGV